MDQPITVKYRLSADDLIQAYRYHFRQTCRPMFRLGLHLIAVSVLLLGGLGCFQESGSSLVVPIVFVVVGVYWLAVRPFIHCWKIRRQYAKRPDKDVEIEWKIASDRLSMQSRLGQSVFLWDALFKIAHAPSGLMLYPSEHIFQFLPRRGFASDSEFEQAAELAKSKVQKFSRVA